MSLPNGGERYEEDGDLLLLSLDAMLDVLADYHRRCILDFLQQTDHQTASFEELVNQLYKEQEKFHGQQLTHDKIQIALRHHHLPKLEDLGIVEYDSRSQTIRYQPNDRLKELYDYIRDFQRE